MDWIWAKVTSTALSKFKKLHQNFHPDVSFSLAAAAAAAVSSQHLQDVEQVTVNIIIIITESETLEKKKTKLLDVKIWSQSV